MYDAFEDKFDKAFIVTADSDLVPPIEKIKILFPEKILISIFPPSRSSKALKKISDNSLKVFEKSLRKSQFDDTLEMKNGIMIRKPYKWK